MPATLGGNITVGAVPGIVSARNGRNIRLGRCELDWLLEESPRAAHLQLISLVGRFCQIAVFIINRQKPTAYLQGTALNREKQALPGDSLYAVVCICYYRRSGTGEII